MAPHVIEKAGPGGREKRSTLSGSISRRMVAESKPRKTGRQSRGRRGDSPCDAFRTAEGLVARHVVCSATGGARTWVQIANPG